MIIKYQQFAETNTFSLSFHILFSPFLHIFPQDTSKSGFGDGQKWAKMGLQLQSVQKQLPENTARATSFCVAVVFVRITIYSCMAR